MAKNKISSTNLRKQLFNTLSRVEKGAQVAIERNGKVIAKLMPCGKGDWRDCISQKPKLNGSPIEVFAPIEDLFDV